VHDPWERLLPDEVAEVEANGVDHAASERVSVELWLGSHGFVPIVPLPDEGANSKRGEWERRLVVYMRSAFGKERRKCNAGRNDGVSIRGHRFRFVGHVFAHMQSLLIDENRNEHEADQIAE
jgi:hypothetical protein